VVWSYRSGSWCPVRRRSFAQSLTSLDARSPAKTSGGVAPVLRRHEKATRLFQSGIRRAKSHETAESPVAQWPHAPHRFDGIGQPATSPPLRRHHRRGRRADCWMGSRYARRVGGEVASVPGWKPAEPTFRASRGLFAPPVFGVFGGGDRE